MYVELPKALWWPCGRRSGRLGTTNFIIGGGVGLSRRGENPEIAGTPSRSLGSERGTVKELDALGLHKMQTIESFRF